MATLAYRFQHNAQPRFNRGHTRFGFDKRYIPIKEIGKGSYGVVCSSVNVETKEKVAIKKISNVFRSRDYTVMILRELMLLRCIKHTNVIAVKDIMMPTDLDNFNDVNVVYELMDTDLHRIIQSSTPLNNDHCKYFMFQLLSGLKHLHSANILHRDLKPGNLLVNNNCELKICDFGLARTGQDNGQPMSEYVVTRWYRAPELLLSNCYGKAVDMWSVGCILAEILGRQPLFPGTDCLNQLELIITLLGRQEEDDLEFLGNTKAKGFVESLSSSSERIPLSCLFPHADPMALDLLSKMLVFNPSRRITVTEALSHPYMSDLYDPSSSPEAEYRIDIDIDESIEEPTLKKLMLREISLYHPGVFHPSYLDVLMSNMKIV